MRHFRRPLDYQRKSDASPVTLADQGIERRLRERIAARFPDHGLLGEEFAPVPGERFTWVIDPIDGTKSFITGMPLFGTLLALHDAEAGRPVWGVIDMPALGERWQGDGRAAWFDGQSARVSDCRDLTQAQICCTSPDFFGAADWAAWQRLSGQAAYRRFGGDCYLYGMLASGWIDLVAEVSLQPFDFLALVPVIEGAGGVISDWEGAPLGMDSDGRVLAAATPDLHDQALAALRGEQ